MNASIVDSLSKIFTPKDVVLNWTDYTGMGVMFSITTMIGIYFGFFGKKDKTTEDFMDGGKKMKVLPVALSLVAR